VHNFVTILYTLVIFEHRLGARSPMDPPLTESLFSGRAHYDYHRRL